MSNNTFIEKKLIRELLFQLADDDFIHSYRGSEWLGLAPHIEEDVATSSITQDTMGHATIFYQLLEELGEGDANQLAHDRSAAARRNAIILELKNGPGHYMEEPDYDWAFAVVRNYFYSEAKMVKMQSLLTSSHKPLAEVAAKVQMELYYHILHWKMWFLQLLTSEHEEAVSRMKAAIERTKQDFKGVFSLGEFREDIVATGLIEDEEVLLARWKENILTVLGSAGQVEKLEVASIRGDGRSGVHTDDLEEALQILCEVYQVDKAASW